MPGKIIIGISGRTHVANVETLRDWWWKSITDALHFDRGGSGVPSLEIRDAALPLDDLILVPWADLVTIGPSAALFFDPETRRITRNQPEELYYEVDARSRSHLGRPFEALSTEFRGLLPSLWNRVFGLIMRRPSSSRLGRENLAALVDYWANGDQVRQRFKKALSEALSSDAEVLVIAHGLGSIIAFDSLTDRDTSSNDQVRLLTLGSPLGLPSIRSRLRSRYRSGSGPAGVNISRWDNCSDPRDKLATIARLAPRLKSPYRWADRIVDYLVDNDYRGPDSEARPANDLGYLRCPEVGRIVADFVGIDIERVVQERRDLALAQRQMEETLRVPENPFVRPGLEVFHHKAFAVDISGDFYGILPRADDSLGIYLVDVEGHGLPASQQARDIYRILSRPDLAWGAGEPSRQLEIADRHIAEELGADGIAVTMNFTEIDPVGMRIRHANAGMPYPILFHPGRGHPEILQSSGAYVGGGYSQYPSTPSETEVGDGDILVVFSDGILEAKDQRGRLFGEDGVTAAFSGAVSRSPRDVGESILSAVAAHTGSDEPQDDQTLVVVQIGNPLDAGVSRLTRNLQRREGPSGSLEFILINSAEAGLETSVIMRSWLVDWAVSHGASIEDSNRMWSATWEAVQNGVKYGSNRGDEIRIRLNEVGERSLSVDFLQPRFWGDWVTFLGDRRKHDLESRESPLGPEPRLGGTTVMLLSSDRLSVSSDGRRVSLRFDLRAKDRRLDARVLTRTEHASGSIEYVLLNSDETGYASHTQLRLELIEWAMSNGSRTVDAEMMWEATWEAVQNAVKHGSTQDERIYVRLSHQIEDYLDVEVQQPRGWPEAAKLLGDEKREGLSVGMGYDPDGPLGGIAIILMFTQSVVVTDGGRSITMRFAVRSASAPAWERE